VQSQEFAGSAWAVGQRCAGVDEAAFRRAFDDGRIVRTHVLRPTWHLVSPADLRWMQTLTAPRVHAANATYYRRSELDAATLTRSADLICRSLAGGRQLTRKELRDVLSAGGVEPGDTLRLSLIAMWCELEALICSGAMRGKQHTYALVEDRAPAAPVRGRDEALGELARRYFASHGPADIADFAWWSGLTKTEAARAGELAGGATLPSSTSSVPGTSPAVHLLANYDEYVVAYQDRSALFATEPLAREFAGMGALSSALVLYRGQIAGHWRRSQASGRVVLTASLRRDLGQAGQRALSAAATRYGRFLGLPVEVESGRILS
jgi:hypothetical protein